MKRIFRFSIVLVIALIGVILACSRQKPDYIGPAYIAAPENFAVTSFTSNMSSISFIPSTSLMYSASFTNSVSWKLTITGNKSGAYHVFEGISNGFTNLQWWGEHDGAFFFKTGETVTATLSFFGTSMVSETTTLVTQAADFKTCGKFSTYGDFENASKITPANKWFAFNSPTPIPNVIQGVASAEIDRNGDTVKAPEGNQYYFIKGKGDQATFVSGIQSTASLSGITPQADNVWVNIYLYGTGDPNAGVEIEYQEADQPGDGIYSPTTDDAFVAYVTLSHIGWKLFSFKYSDLTPTLNADFGGSGNRKHEPNRLRSWDIVLVKKTDPNSPIAVYFDYPIITTGGPFKPCH
ncbi:MAG: hypothetical protein JWM14_1648 [Chitinophagaceae bacterium]|nr:hypothetical protein [Chitinophagaceae bacterium]